MNTATQQSDLYADLIEELKKVLKTKENEIVEIRKYQERFNRGRDLFYTSVIAILGIAVAIPQIANLLN